MTQNRDGEDAATGSGSGGPAKDNYGSGASPFQPAARRPVLQRLVPVSEQLPDYHGGTLRRDLLAGVTVAALALPAAMAYAELAGLSPVAGLYALLLPTVAYTLLGSSRQLIVGPEGSIAALVAAALIPLAADDPERYASLAALLAVLVGAVFLVARLIRLGWVADYFSRAVLIGYIHGVAVVLIIGQLGKLLGLDIDAQDPLAQLAEVIREISELTAMGAANLAAGITQAFPIGASGSRTAVNDQMGGRTQISGLIGAAAIACVLLFLTEPMQYLPKAALGAVIVAAAVGLIEPAAWRGLARTSRVEVAIAAVTMAGVVAVGVLKALLVAVALSIVDVARRSATPHDAVLGWVERLGRYADVGLHPRAQVTPGVLVYRLDDRLFFANASYVKGRIREAINGAPTPVRWLVFDAEALAHVDATGVDTLTELIGSLQQQQITFVFARLKTLMRQQLQEAGVVDLVGEDRLYPTVRAAVQAASAPPPPGKSERVDGEGESDPP
jgi:MFS superfamily sulfate permease-like transporter